jgi:hypothetical protein
MCGSIPPFPILLMACCHIKHRISFVFFFNVTPIKFLSLSQNLSNYTAYGVTLFVMFLYQFLTFFLSGCTSISNQLTYFMKHSP